MIEETYIIGDYQGLINKVSSTDTQRYLRFGFNMRLLHIKELNFQLNNAIKKDGNNRNDPYTTCKLNIALNAFYLNLIGALDNLAWAIQHEFSIINQKDMKNKFNISLFNKTFQKQLALIDKKYLAEIQEFTEWFSDLKEFRDPAAHRMPLYCPPGILTTEHTKTYAKAKKELESKDFIKDHESYMDSFYDLNNIGTFKPVFCVFSSSGDKIYPLFRTTKSDYEPFWKISISSYQFFIRNSPNSSA